MHTTLDLDQTPPFEIRAVPQDASQPIATPFRDRLLVLTVHDGHGIPERYLTGDDGTPLIDPAELARIRALIDEEVKRNGDTDA